MKLFQVENVWINKSLKSTHLDYSYKHHILLYLCTVTIKWYFIGENRDAKGEYKVNADKGY